MEVFSKGSICATVLCLRCDILIMLLLAAVIDLLVCLLYFFFLLYLSLWVAFTRFQVMVGSDKLEPREDLEPGVLSNNPSIALRAALLSNLICITRGMRQHELANW